MASEKINHRGKISTYLVWLKGRGYTLSGICVTTNLYSWAAALRADMTDEKDTQLGKYLVGLTRPEPPQSRAGKDGDPQLAALHQLLADRASRKLDEDIIVDIGSGAGILATAITKIWGARGTPRYVAVDLEKALEDLALPIPIHNNSEKIEFRQFFDYEISRYSCKHTMFVIRNVFHELDIDETGYVLAKLNTHLDSKTTIYIQDMQRLPRAERGNAGWDAERFASLLRRLNMKPQLFNLKSHGGIWWFAIITAPTGQQTSQKEAALACAEQRRLQKRQMASEIERLNRTYSEETTEALQVLFTELSMIELQLGRHEQSQHIATSVLSGLDIGGLPFPFTLLRIGKAFPLHLIETP
jgi:hypothetical protein